VHHRPVFYHGLPKAALTGNDWDEKNLNGILTRYFNSPQKKAVTTPAVTAFF